MRTQVAGTPHDPPKPTSNRSRHEGELMNQPPLATRLLAEIVGTFGFFFIGFSGIAAAVNLPGSIAPAGIAAGFGLGLGLMIAAFGQISGGHFNPAVSLGLGVARKFPMTEVIQYWVAQLIGGFIAVVVAVILYTSDIKKDLVNAPGKGVADWRALLIEAVAVFLFVSVIITVATDDSAAWKGVLAPVAIGGFIFTAALTMGPSSGGSFNPARSLDPAIFAGEFGNVWIYIVGPLAGALVAGAVSMGLRGERP
jgi:MIP family channel proteins